jgi:hypothetical protein
MALSFVASGTWVYTGATGSLATGSVTGVANGDLLRLAVLGKYEAWTVATPAGWTLEDDGNTTGITAGNDAGNTRCVIFTRVYDGTGTINPSITIGGTVNVIGAVVAAYRATSGVYSLACEVITGTKTDNGAGGWNLDGVASSTLGLDTGDILDCNTVLGGDGPTFGASATVTATGATLANHTLNTANGSSATGTDMRVTSYRRDVTAGPATGNVTHSQFIGGSTTTAWSGAIGMLRIREVSAGATATPAVVATAATAPAGTLALSGQATPAPVASTVASPVASASAATGATKTPAAVAATTAAPASAIALGKLVASGAVTLTVACPTAAPALSKQVTPTPVASTVAFVAPLIHWGAVILTASVRMGPPPGAEQVASPDYFSHGLLIDKAEIDGQPMSGSAWTNMLAEANAEDAATQATYADVNGDFNTQTFAKAVVYARMKGSVSDSTADPYREMVRARLEDFVGWTIAPGAEQLGRNTGLLALSADFINLGALDPTLDASFRTKLADVIALIDPANADGMNSVIDGSLRRPNNHGVVCRLTLTFVYLYLGGQTTAIQNHVLNPLRRWLGDTSFHNGSTVGTNKFAWGTALDADTWMLNEADDTTYVGINPLGATKDGHNFDGLQPEDQRRGTPTAYNSADFPNAMTAEYTWFAAAEAAWNVYVLERNGYTGALGWSNSAVKRAIDHLYYLETNFSGDGYNKISGGTYFSSLGVLENFLYGTSRTIVTPTTQARYFYSGTGFDHFLFAGRTL